MRLVRIILCLISLYHQLLPTECEIFLSSLMKFVDVDRRGWQRALSLEALHRVIVRPDIVRWLCENFDARSNSTKVLEHLSSSILSVVQQSFIPTKIASDGDLELDIGQPRGSSGFYFSSVWHPYVEHLSAKKSLLLDSLERHEAGTLPDGYVISRATSALADFVQSVYAAVDALSLQDDGGDKNNNNHVAAAIFTSCQPNLLAALSLLLSASTDESVTDHLLCALSTLMSVGCKLKMGSASLNCLYVLCCACLPSVSYLHTYAAFEAPKGSLSEQVFDSASSLHEVVASGTPCPSPVVAPDKWNDQVMLTSRNLQATRILLSSICAHAAMMDELWYLSLLTCQHVAWMLGIRPSSNGIFTKEKPEADPQSNASVITTAALSEIPVLTSLFDKIACTSVSLSNESLLKTMESIMRLSDENVAVAATGRDCSLFPLAMLLRFSSLNLHRQKSFWGRVTAHFIKICGHTTPSLREWSAVALASIIKQAFKAKTDMSVAEHQQLTLSTLRSLCLVHQPDVQRRQLDCLMALLQTDGAQLVSDMWQHVIHIVASVVDEENGCDEALVRQGYLGLRLVAADFLQSLPFECISSLVEAVARYGKQMADHNISLSALTQLWTISDFVFRKSEEVGADASEKVWLVLYTCLSELCIDVRPSVRKSACQTLLQTVASHGHALRISTWNHMVWQIIMPLLDRVRVQTRSASTERTSGALLMHHSRDTQQKQWTETCIHTLSAASKIFIAQRKSLLSLSDFGSAWEALLSYVEWAACYQNAELSLAAIKSFQEVLLGKVSAQTLDINTRERASSAENTIDDIIPTLPLPQWIESWNTWQRISRGLARMGTGGSSPDGKTTYVPGPSHLTTLLHIFPPLFEHVARHICVDELKAEQLPSTLESLINVPVPSEQAPFVMQSMHSHMSPTQEAVCEAIRSIYNECISPGSQLRDALADQIRQLLRFSGDFGSAWEALLSYVEWAACYQNAELSLAAIKSFQEVLLGKVSAQTLDINTRERASSAENTIDDIIPTLPLPQWIESWNTWQRISRGLARMGTGGSSPDGKTTYVPGPSHLTTLLHIFPPLFEHVARHICVDELKAEQLPSTLESLINVPVPSEQAPFVMQSMHSHMSPTQEAVCEAIRSIYNECISPGSQLRDALADQIRQLLRFSGMALRTPAALRPSGLTSSGQKDFREWALQWVVPFSETCLRMAIEFLSATVAYPEVIRSLVVVDVVKFLGEPLYMKYSCISPSTWKLAASSLMTVLRIAVPHARQNVEHFEPLWPAICDTLEKFLFTPNVCPRLAADERKRDELTECQIVELVRSELLLHSSCLPQSMIQRLISILNRGSISQLDPTDVLDSHAQRVELARTCFDALLSTSSEGNGRLGNVAVASLLQRCSQVMNDFVRDFNATGDLRLPRGRIAEITSALQAVDSLIGRLAREPTQSELYSQLVSLYPSVVNVVQCTRSDPMLESQLIATLKSYQTLLLLRVVPLMKES
ncbi:HEAT repeat protein [Oesophagostomum dentatum]|uniref:HEAT repeat protein n=1 Tax=Oesophagostomum dentatum TaxID=61180 RepID=A0A0B1TAD1_OESDE|nr:HEAT repeat protein [Oesophagostomum dentatum]